MEHVDTLEQPKKENEVKSRKKARNKAWGLANPERDKARQKAYYAGLY